MVGEQHLNLLRARPYWHFATDCQIQIEMQMYTMANAENASIVRARVAVSML